MPAFLSRALILLMLTVPQGLGAQTPSAEKALEAAAALDAAMARLDQAEGAQNRVKALTETIQAFEAGLGAMREGLRQAAIRETQLSQKLRAEEAEIAQFIAVLQAIGDTSTPVSLLHPNGALGTARAGMLLAELTPALNRRATRLRQDLEEVQMLRSLQSDAAERLQIALNAVQDARMALSTAMANRTDLPQRFTADPVRTGILIASTETLEGFASGLAEIANGQITPISTSLEGQRGALSLPANGLVLRQANAPDAAGVRRPGIILATRPGAIVTTPSAATIRYTGPLLEFGNVVILEPEADVLFVLAGMGSVYGLAGQVIAQGTPLGLMGGTTSENGDSLSPLREGTGRELTETLYIEVRENNIPQNPSDWFRTDEDG